MTLESAPPRVFALPPGVPFARRFAEGFTWQNAADQTEAHLREVMGREEGR